MNDNDRNGRSVYTVMYSVACVVSNIFLIHSNHACLTGKYCMAHIAHMDINAYERLRTPVNVNEDCFESVAHFNSHARVLLSILWEHGAVEYKHDDIHGMCVIYCRYCSVSQFLLPSIAV